MICENRIGAAKVIDEELAFWGWASIPVQATHQARDLIRLYEWV